MIVNGKEYPMWSQFVDRKEEWVGGLMRDYGDSMDRHVFDNKVVETTITDIELIPNGEHSAFFRVCGENFDCGFDVKVGGIASVMDESWLTFSGYMGHKWQIKKKNQGAPPTKEQP